MCVWGCFYNTLAYPNEQAHRGRVSTGLFEIQFSATPNMVRQCARFICAAAFEVTVRLEEHNASTNSSGWDHYYLFKPCPGCEEQSDMLGHH